MKFINKIGGVLRPVRSWGVLGLISALAVTFGSYSRAFSQAGEPCCFDLEYPAGEADNFAPPGEPSWPSGALQQTVNPPGGFVGFDDPGLFETSTFGHTFVLRSGKCIEAAELEFRTKPLGFSSADDKIYLGSVPCLRFPGWEVFFGSGNTSAGLLNIPWSAGNFPTGHTFALDLGNLPTDGNLIPALNSNRFLDIVILDNTSVDYLKLTVTFCECEGCVQPPVGMVAWYTGDDCGPADFFGSHNGMFVGAAACPLAWKVGEGGMGFFPGTYISVPDATALNIRTGGFTVDLWLKTTADGYRPMLDKQFPGYSIGLQDGHVRFDVCTSFKCLAGPETSAVVNDGCWHHIAATLSRPLCPECPAESSAESSAESPDRLDIYIDGALAASASFGDLGDITGPNPLLIGAFPSFSAPGSFFDGEMDEIEIFNRALSASEIQAIYLAGSAGKCKGPSSPGDFVKNRFLSFVVPSGAAAGVAEETAIQIELTALNHMCSADSDNLFEPCTTDDDCTNGVCDRPFSASERQVRYVNVVKTCQGGAMSTGEVICRSLDDCAIDEECLQFRTCDGTTDLCAMSDQCDKGVPCLASMSCPDDVFQPSFLCATTGCEPEYRDWASDLAGGVLYVYGPGIVPARSAYNVRQIPAACAGNEASCASASEALMLATARWADMTADGATNAQDITAASDKVKPIPSAFTKVRTMLIPGILNPFRNVNVLELQNTVDAVKSLPMTGLITGPEDCGT